MRVPLIYLGRILLLVLMTMAAIYCVLCFLPSTNQNLIQGDLVDWLPSFVRLQPLLFTIFALLGLLPIARGPGVSALARWASALVLAGFACWLWIAQPLSHAGMDPGTLTTGLLMLAPVLLLGIIDFVDSARAIEWAELTPGDSWRTTLAVGGTGLIVAVLFASVGAAHAPANWLGAGDFASLALSVVWTQLVAAAITVVILLAVRSLTSFTSANALVETVLLLVLAGAGLHTLLLGKVLIPIGFGDDSASRYAALMACTIALSVAGSGARIHAAGGGGPVDSGFALIVSGIGPWTRARKWICLTGLVASVCLIALACIRTASFDWDYLLQKLLAILAWILVSGSLFQLSGKPRIETTRTSWSVALALVALGGFVSLPVQLGALASTSRVKSADDLQEAWRGFDPAYRVVSEALAPQSGALVGEIYSYLRANTNISRARKTVPASVDLVHNLKRTSDPRPDIVIVVIDSLRPDFVAPLNPRVTFTPRIAEIARESTVFRNAFSHYGATGLAAPSIWVGGLMLHQQYVTPFAPMNALQKLLRTDGYHSYIGYLPLLKAVVKDEPGIERLPSVSLNEDLCLQVDALLSRVAKAPSDGTPMFAYLHGLNIHISSINREGPQVPKGESYPGFIDAYAWRMRRMDGCIGRLVAGLKNKGIWDSTVFIVTADHGDSIGEGGRWGHAYTITPEVLRIPLIIRLPEAYRQSLGADPDELVFSTDITPSLYYILGHRPIVNDELFGRPLFTRSPDERRPYMRKNYVVASSYGPVWGILSASGRQLFVADSVNFRDHVWQLDANDSASQRKPDTMETATAYIELRRQIDMIASFYKFDAMKD